MIASIHQPNFLPWLGYFHKIARSDRFVLLDDVQYVKGTVANRAYIRRKDGKAVYITVPVRMSKGAYQNYNEIEIDHASGWQAKMLNQIRDAYQKAPGFPEVYQPLAAILQKKHPVLSALNIDLIRFAMGCLEIDTPLVLASSIPEDLGAKSDRNLNICRYLGAGKYLSGTGAKAYNDELSFSEKGIEIVYTRFSPDDACKAPAENGQLVNLSIVHFLMCYTPEKVKDLILHSSTTY